MDVKITSGKSLNGVIYSSPSKSYSHRAFFLSLLRRNPTRLERPLRMGDVTRTIKTCSRLGAKINQVGRDSMELIPPKSIIAPADAIDCGNSGTTVRLLTALSLITTGEMKIVGIFFKRNRPIKELLTALESLGTKWRCLGHNNDIKDGICLETKEIKTNNVSIKGDVSSQYISGLMISGCGLLYKKNTSTEKGFKWNNFIIETTSKVKSYPYILITKEICEDFGFTVNIDKFDDGRIKIELQAPKSLLTDDNQLIYKIAGDFSSASFMIAASVLYSNKYDVEIRNLSINTNQGDKEIVTLLKDMGANITINEDSIEIHGRENVFEEINGVQQYIPYLSGTEVGFQNIPDLFPIFAVISSYCTSKSHLKNAEHVRLKETDRIAVLRRELDKFNVNVEENPDGLVINPVIDRNEVDNIEIVHDEDHRIIMAMTVFCLGMKTKSITIKNISAVSDSYPEFFSDLRTLGANIEFIDN